jgi:hypothetical protein
MLFQLGFLDLRSGLLIICFAGLIRSPFDRSKRYRALIVIVHLNDKDGIRATLSRLARCYRVSIETNGKNDANGVKT